MQKVDLCPNESKAIKLEVNGERCELKVADNVTLLQVLRDDLGLTGVKCGCGTGECGVCTVLVDRRPVLSCLILAIEMDNHEILTIEGLAKSGSLHPLQQAMIDHDGLQCGYCTPAVILCAKALLDQNPNPTQEEVKEALAGTLCRCGSYPGIIRAVLAAAEKMRRSDQ
jgi:carbon-monoxide dehydrogenase small subunit